MTSTKHALLEQQNAAAAARDAMGGGHRRGHSWVWVHSIMLGCHASQKAHSGGACLLLGALELYIWKKGECSEVKKA